MINIEYIKDNRTDLAVISSDSKVITDVQSALDLAMMVKAGPSGLDGPLLFYTSRTITSSP